MTDFKDVYAEGIEVGMALGRKLGLSEAIAVLLREQEGPAATALGKYYEKLLADERERVLVLTEGR